MSDDRDYEVGKGKPPKHTQFKKGQSGNKRGRPKGTKNTGSVIRSVLERNVTVRDNGKTRQVPFMEAFVQTLIEKALKGSTSDQIKLLQLMEDYVPSMLKEPETPEKFIVQYVLPDGKTIEDYENEDAFGNRKHADPEK